MNIELETAMRIIAEAIYCARPGDAMQGDGASYARAWCAGCDSARAVAASKVADQLELHVTNKFDRAAFMAACGVRE
jgi:hypothetical protein